MVDDLLNVSRIQSGRVTIKLDRVRVFDVLEEVLSMAKESSNKHEFVVEIEPDLPDVLVDRDKFGQVIGNLLSNAVKFTPEQGRIDIKGEVTSEDNKDFVQISVSDTGEGIPEDQVEKVFEKFHQVDSTEKQRKAGTGLGLSICREIMKHHSGKIWAESEVGKGSTFYFTLPVAEKK